MLVALPSPIPFAHAATLDPCTVSTSDSATALTTDELEYARDIQPILQTHCLRCHGPDKQEGDLRLDLRQSAFAAASSGEIPIVPFDTLRSHLLEVISGENPAMPADGPSLSIEQQARLRQWIAEGAAWPEEAAPATSAKKLWSMAPLNSPSLPTYDQSPPHPIDVFIQSQLREQGLKPSPPADRRTLLRRLYFDLWGLPPTPDDLRQFIDDLSPHAIENVIDRLLASPRFGERWGRHWLDVVRFAETTGFETNVDRPRAYPYRDWVVQAFNSDLPFHQFAAAQIAGDQLGHDAATGFLVAGAWDQVKSPDPNLTMMQREDELADMVGTTSTTFLGLTLACARCHQHKFDPLSQADYYAVKAILAGTQHGERPLTSSTQANWLARKKELQQLLQAGERQWLEHEPLARVTDHPIAANQGAVNQVAASPSLQNARSPIQSRRNVDRFASISARKIRFEILQTNQSEPCLDECEVWSVDAQGHFQQNVALASYGTKVTSSGNFPDTSKHRLELVHDGQYGNDSSWISNTNGTGWIELEFPHRVQIGCVIWGRDRQSVYQDRTARRYRIQVTDQGEDWSLVADASDRLEHPQPPTSLVASTESTSDAAMSEKEKLARHLQTLEQQIREVEQEIAQSSLLYAGRFEEAPIVHRLYRGEPQSPREVVAPNIPHQLGTLAIDANTPEAKRRLALADWLGQESNGLVARVIVNRLWHYHFGRGIVVTPNDFGNNGASPTHPELLDWLAKQLIEHDWSLKHIHRLILTSHTYQQASHSDPHALAVDADARWLWRFPPRRLEGEAIRDAMLAVAGNLDLRMGGPGFSTFEPNENYVRVYNPKTAFQPTDFRRMVYMTRVRMVPDATFGAFDLPDGGLSCPVRSRSTNPLQAFHLLNSPFVTEQATAFASRLTREVPHDQAKQIELAFSLTFGRPPDAIEQHAAESLVAKYGLSALTRSLFNASEFLVIP